MNKKITILTISIIILSILLINTNLLFASSAWGGSPTTTTTIYNTLNTFKSCNDGSTTKLNEITFCPENEWIEKMVSSTTPNCISWDGDPARCLVWGNPLEDITITEYCNTPLKTRDTTAWKCPTCKELSIRQEEQPLLDLNSFNSLSIGNNPLRSNTTSNITYTVYIEACLNRVPMTNINLTLTDDFGTIKEQETGLSAKHDTMNYTEDNIGYIGDFKLPTQNEFKKNYTFSGELKAYRPWAFRERLIDAINRTVLGIGSSIGLPEVQYPVSATAAQRVENIYYSTDFIGGDTSGVNAKNNNACGGRIETTMSTEIDTLTIGNINIGGNSHNICTISDLNSVYTTYKGTPEYNSLLDIIKTKIGIPEGWNTEMLDFEINTNPAATFNFIIKAPNIINLNVTEIGYENSTEFENYMLNSLTSGSSRYNYLKSINLITDSNLLSSAKTINGDTDICGTTTYTHRYSNTFTYSSGDISLNKINDDEVNIILSNIDITANKINDIIVNIDTTFIKDYDCSDSWNWGNLAELPGKTLATCLYHWDECILKEVSDSSNELQIVTPKSTPNTHTEVTRTWPYYEVADCGMGPDSEIDIQIDSKTNLERTTRLQDAATGNKTIFNTVTVYRSCTDTNWVSSERTHACIEGDIYKCRFTTDLGDETTIGVTTVPVDYTNLSRGSAYLCQANGLWQTLDCDEDSTNSTDDDELSCVNTGTNKGMCGAISGTYTWQQDSENSQDACCCLSTGFWDSDTGQCCDAGEEWISYDGEWTCKNTAATAGYNGPTCSTSPTILAETGTSYVQTAVIFTPDCAEQEILGEMNWWNGSHWVTTAPEQCGCTSDSNCEGTKQCLENMCIDITAQTLNFIPENTTNIIMGDTQNIVLNVTNNMDVTDNIKLNIIDTAGDISDWAWFKGQKNLDPHTKIISIPAHSDKKVIIDVMGGKLGSYELQVISESTYTLETATKGKEIKVIPVTQTETNEAGKVETETTPGLSWIGFILVMIMGSFIANRKYKV